MRRTKELSDHMARATSPKADFLSSFYQSYSRALVRQTANKKERRPKMTREIARLSYNVLIDPIT